MYETIVFFQYSSAAPFLNSIKKNGPKATLEKLSAWDNADVYERRLSPPWGSTDKVFRHNGYAMSYNETTESIGLYRAIE